MAVAHTVAVALQFDDRTVVPVASAIMGLVMRFMSWKLPVRSSAFKKKKTLPGTTGPPTLPPSWSCFWNRLRPSA